MSFYRQQLEDWLSSYLVSADTVYDVGGAQNPVKGRTETWKVKNYKILDLPEYDIEDEDFWLNDLYTADIIFCLEVFEYLINPIQALENLAGLIKDTGIIIATFQFAYPLHEEVDLDSLRYTETGVRRLAERVGLRCEQFWYREDKSDHLQQFYAADGMHPAKSYSHHNATGFIVEFKK